MLEKTHHQHALVAGEDVLGSVAVMHVEVDDGHALQAVPLQRVLGADRDVVEKAEAHRAVVAGMVAGRAHRAEGVFEFARDDRVGGRQHRAGGTQRRVPGVRVHQGVGVDLGIAAAARLDVIGQLVAHPPQGGYVHARMRQFDVVGRSRRRVAALQHQPETAGQQPVLDRVEALGAFGMARPHFVSPAIGMREIPGFSHGTLSYANLG